MLNELLTLKKGAEQAGMELTIRHPDIKDSRNIPTFIVGLSKSGDVVEVRTKSEDASPWTLSDGNHNSFPFVQLKLPLKQHPFGHEDELIERVLDRRNSSRREDFLKWLAQASSATNSLADWPGSKLLQRVSDRFAIVESMKNGRSDVVPKTLEYFTNACASKAGPELLEEICAAIEDTLAKTPDAGFLDAAIALFLGKFNKKASRWENQGGLVFEAVKCKSSIIHSKLIGDLSKCLNKAETSNAQRKVGLCYLTGDNATAVIDDKFPQPNLPVLGQTYLFSRNSASKSNVRYGHNSVETMPIGVDVANSLAAAFMALTEDRRRNITWRPIPGEAPKQTDLLIAYVREAPDAAIAGLIADERDGDFEDESDILDQYQKEDAFEQSAKRILEAIKAQVSGDFRKTEVSFNVFRKVDPANRKVVYRRSLSVGQLYDAAVQWTEGENNLPLYLKLFSKRGKRKPENYNAPHIAPLGLIAFSKRLFQRGGLDSQEVAGIPASEAMSLFLLRDHDSKPSVKNAVKRFLKQVLRRRMHLCSTAVHLLRKRDWGMVNKQNHEALRTASVLGILLLKLGRTKEHYMNEAAFKLGQLLAAADVVHAGYCADVRGGAVPPSLLGNQLLSMAQASPEKALSVWCRRWKPYDGWARKMHNHAKDRARLEAMQAKGKPTQKAWDIKKAMRNWREMKPLAESLHECLKSCKVDDGFRSELLLGYMAGIPDAKTEKETSD